MIYWISLPVIRNNVPSLKHTEKLFSCFLSVSLTYSTLFCLSVHFFSLFHSSPSLPFFSNSLPVLFSPPLSFPLPLSPPLARSILSHSLRLCFPAHFPPSFPRDRCLSHSPALPLFLCLLSLLHASCVCVCVWLVFLPD